MPNLKEGEHMHACESRFHFDIRKQTYYVVRPYHNEIEKHFCQGCLSVLQFYGVVKYVELEGYKPEGMSIEDIIDVYGTKESK